MTSDKVKYWVNVHEYVYTTRERIDDGWDRGDEDMDANITGISKSRIPEWDPVEAAWTAYDVDDIEVGQVANIVFVEYTTGDTFGSSGTWCVAAVKSDVHEAEKIARKCEDPNDNSASVAFRPWDGYFEHIKSATVVPLVVK